MRHAASRRPATWPWSGSSAPGWSRPGRARRADQQHDDHDDEDDVLGAEARRREHGDHGAHASRLTRWKRASSCCSAPPSARPRRRPRGPCRAGAAARGRRAAPSRRRTAPRARSALRAATAGQIDHVAEQDQRARARPSCPGRCRRRRASARSGPARPRWGRRARRSGPVLPRNRSFSVGDGVLVDEEQRDLGLPFTPSRLEDLAGQLGPAADVDRMSLPARRRRRRRRSLRSDPSALLPARRRPRCRPRSGGGPRPAGSRWTNARSSMPPEDRLEPDQARAASRARRSG